MTKCVNAAAASRKVGTETWPLQGTAWASPVTLARVVIYSREQLLHWNEIRGCWETKLEEILSLTTHEGSSCARQRGKHIIHIGKYRHGLDTNSLLPKKAVGESTLERQKLTTALHRSFQEKNSRGLR